MYRTTIRWGGGKGKGKGKDIGREVMSTGSSHDELLKWSRSYASAMSLYSESASMRYEVEQSNAIRLFPGEAINQVLREPSNFFPGRAPPQGTEWQLRAVSRVGDS